MKILSIETSCDETAAAVVEKKEHDKTVTLLSNVVASSLTMHAKTGGIIPEVAAREQLKFIVPVIDEALQKAKCSGKNIDAIAVTYGPGLIGSLLVGVETAKTLSYVWNKPIIPVNHLIGHIYANFINQTLPFPALALIVSGGHTDLVLLNNHQKIKWLGGTRDDAAGEAFDKIGRLLNLPYPAGPMIEKLAKKAESDSAKAYNFPRPLMYDKEPDFSFSGLKTAVFREIKSQTSLTSQTVNDLCASVQQAIIDVLVKKTLDAAQKYNVKSILLGGGVAANQTLREQLEQSAIRNLPSAKIFCPTKNLCTDNAAMIGAAAFFNYKEIPWQQLTADPELYFD